MTNQDTKQADKGKQNEAETNLDRGVTGQELRSDPSEDPRAQNRADQLRARFSDITDDEIELSRVNVDKAAVQIADRTGQDVHQVRQGLQTVSNVNQSSATFQQGEGSAPTAGELNEQSRQMGERRDQQNQESEGGEKAPRKRS